MCGFSVLELDVFGPEFRSSVRVVKFRVVGFWNGCLGCLSLGFGDLSQGCLVWYLRLFDGF